MKEEMMIFGIMTQIMPNDLSTKSKWQWTEHFWCFTPSLSSQESSLLQELILLPSRSRLRFSNLGLTAVAWSPLGSSIVFLIFFFPNGRGGNRSISASSSNPFPWESFACVWCIGCDQLCGPAAYAWSSYGGFPEVDKPSDSLEMFHYCCVANVQIIVSALYCRPFGNKSSFAAVVCDSINFNSDCFPNQPEGGRADSNTLPDSALSTLFKIDLSTYLASYLAIYLYKGGKPENFFLILHHQQYVL